MTPHPESISIAQARRLALAGAGLLAPRHLGLPERAGVRSALARERCHRIVEHFGYLQIDTVAVSGARTHCIVLASRLPGLDAALAETLLAPGAPLFEYWGHEACWLPLSLYPCFAWRRKQYRVHPWCGDVLREHRRLARSIVKRIECEGALRSLDLKGRSGAGWSDLKLSRRGGPVAVARRADWRSASDAAFNAASTSSSGSSPPMSGPRRVSTASAFDTLLLRALAGHGWASTGTVAATWRLVKCPRPDPCLAKTLAGDRQNPPVRAAHRGTGAPRLDPDRGSGTLARAGTPAAAPRPRRPAVPLRSVAVGPGASAGPVRLRGSG